MALRIYDTVKPQGSYPAVEAEDVEMPDGTRLSKSIPVYLTRSQHNAMVEAGEIVEGTLYMILEDST